MEAATKYVGSFYCYSYDEILDLSLSFTLILFMLQLRPILEMKSF